MLPPTVVRYKTRQRRARNHRSTHPCMATPAADTCCSSTFKKSSISQRDKCFSRACRGGGLLFRYVLPVPVPVRLTHSLLVRQSTCRFTLLDHANPSASRRRLHTNFCSPRPLPVGPNRCQLLSPALQTPLQPPPSATPHALRSIPLSPSRHDAQLLGSGSRAALHRGSSDLQIDTCGFAVAISMSRMVGEGSAGGLPGLPGLPRALEMGWRALRRRMGSGRGGW